MTTIRAAITLTFDDAAWGAEYGMEIAEVPADIAEYMQDWFTEGLRTLPMPPRTTNVRCAVAPVKSKT